MIRVLALLLAILIGVAVAGISQGRIHHLRLAQTAGLVGGLPDWSDAIAADAGLLNGSMRLPETVGRPVLTVTWRAQVPTGDGLRWQVELTGPGIDLRAHMRLSFDLQQAVFDGASGTVDITRLGGVAQDLGGILDVTEMNMTVQGLRAAPYASGTILAQWLRATYQGQALGQGPVRFELDPLLSWRGGVDLAGGVAEINAALSGRLPRLAAGLVLQVSDDPQLPKAWQRALTLAGQKTDNGWSVQQTLTANPG